MDVLRVEELAVQYENKQVLKHVSLGISAGKITTIIGPNGCGKSTLLKAMGRLVAPAAGRVLLNGQEVRQLDTREVARQVTLLPQSATAPLELTVAELVAYGRYPHRRGGRLTAADRQAMDWAMEMTAVAKFRQRSLAALSGGERQRVWLAMALAQETPLLLLDEPTTYLDIVHQLGILKVVRRLNEERGCTVVMVLHDINQAAEFSHELVALRDGQVVAAGTPQEVVTAENLRRIFAITAEVQQDPLTGRPFCVKYDTLPELSRCS